MGQLYAAPGNAGTAEVAGNLDLSVNDFEAIKKAVLDKGIKLVVVGPEEPLVRGLVDYFNSDPDLNGIRIIGPDAEGAKLEGSKDYAKEFMKKYNIPTARYESFTVANMEQGFDFLDRMNPPFVLKADGLAAGKGVVIIEDVDVAKIELRRMLEDKKFGDASSKVVIEEFLDGIEISVFVLTDGTSYNILPNAKDYKRIGENDTGLNTGGMGAVSPVPFATSEFLEKVEQKIVKPTLKGIQSEGMNYKGFIFLGLMMVDGEPFVIEYNVRMGDPETEVVVPRIKNDLLDVLLKTSEGNLNQLDLAIDERAAATVMMVSGGYPEAFEKGKTIEGLNDLNDCTVFHAGTSSVDGKILTNGGRVIAVTSMDTDIHLALNKSYREIDKIRFEKSYYRKDIGFDL